MKNCLKFSQKFMRKTVIEKTKEELEAEVKNQAIDEEHWYLSISEALNTDRKYNFLLLNSQMKFKFIFTAFFLEIVLQLNTAIIFSVVQNLEECLLTAITL